MLPRLRADISRSRFLLALPVLLVMGAAALTGHAGQAGRAAAAAPPRMPQTLNCPPLEQPVWVESGLVLGPGGTPDRRLMHPSVERMIADLLRRREEGGCIRLGVVWEDCASPQPRGSLEDALRTADFILQSRVTGLSHGFYAGIPGTLLRLAPIAVLRACDRSGQSGKSLPSAYYTFMPEGTFTVGMKRICKSDDRYPPLPELDDEVVVFTFLPTGEHHDQLLVQDPGDLVVIHAGKPHFARRYLEHAAEATDAPPLPRTREELLLRIRKAEAHPAGQPLP